MQTLRSEERNIMHRVFWSPVRGCVSLAGPSSLSLAGSLKLISCLSSSKYYD
ncbi:hypothetical protein Lalb_Chr08g0235131 [Lupinus albus]|uniref:Uncharacterized protein n=1 Tax=Lupinus albus TaxID=3870 RepID=A0A6A4Q360_LUPAL|nr:hypothetical protein Lalb_Chr08g0235131 [Lupinus albus]